MTMRSTIIPDGFHTLTPYLIVKGAAEALTFYQKAFDAVELMRINAPDGSIVHGEFKIGDSIVMISEENPGCGSASPETLGGSPVTLYVYVDDVDTVCATAVEAGAKAIMPVSDRFWGDRTGQVVDPFGHRWHLATHVEDVAPDELPGRMAACFAQQAECTE